MPKTAFRRPRRPQKFNPVDIHVGARVRLCRTLLGMSQAALAERIDLTFQQVQKYERGANRIGASRLFDLSCILGVPVSFFFDGMDAATMAGSPAHRPGVGAAVPAWAGPSLDAQDVVRTYSALPESLRYQIRALLRALAAGQSAERAAE